MSIESLTPPQRVEIAKFEFEDQAFRILEGPTRTSPNIFQMITVDEHREYGFMQGSYSDRNGQTVFSSSYIANLLRGEHEPLDGYVPHIVGVSIAQLLAQRRIDVWRSSVGVQLPAEKMYEDFLGSMDELHVASLGAFQYEVTRRDG